MISRDKLIRLLNQNGVTEVRKGGNHPIYEDKFGRRAPIPLNHRKAIGKGLLGKILKKFDINR